MSRCFPFPPPGYEKKLILDAANVPKKEKTKDKKHKEKKDKEKRERKDKKDKEKSDGKHREKKDKKEKRKDKKKDKDKHKENNQEKGSTPIEKRVSGPSEEYNRAKFPQSEKVQGTEKKERTSTSEDKRQINQFDYGNGEKIHQKVEKSRDKRNTSDEKKLAMQLQAHTGEVKSVQKCFADKGSQDSEFLLEFGKRISDEGKGSGGRLVEGVMGMDFKKDERTDKLAMRDTRMVVEGEERIKNKLVDNRKINEQKIHREDKFNGNAMPQNLTGSIQNKIEVPKIKDKVEGRMEGREKSKEREKSDDKRGDKRKSKHKDKQSQGKEKKSDKEKQKEDKAKKEHKKTKKDTSKSSNKNDVGTPNSKTSQFSKDSDKNAATEGVLKKRKDTEKNGFLHEYVIRPEKMPRLSSHPLSENGQESETSQITTLFTPQKQGMAINFEVDNKDKKMNDLTGPHQLPISAPKPSPVIAEQIAESSKKIPHPDIKYLRAVLSVPQMDEWSDVDDQAWLFSNKDSLSNKSEVCSVGGNHGQEEVWAEALRIESADVLALPYVIPY